MNCDRVFDILTRGPFPAGEADDAVVERHLFACHECRQLAEALRPAVSLFHESLAADQGSGLPAYLGTLTERPAQDLATSVRLAIAQETAVRASQPEPSVVRSQRPARQIAPPLLGAAALVLLLCVGMSFFGVGSAGPSGDTHAATVRFQPDRQGLAQLAALSLPASCLSPSPVTGQRFCCTECHSTARPQRPQIAAVALMEQSCSACHTGR
ncbi:anti-sigma factor [Lignipirellula cremea]|uniref:Zinc-finger domain-containing protein n=1 Tax=Lignipirellula cremea TaxID=2528010 RepID=A0A518DYE9_9BACT|nr:hypothetical protein [Lignipirellula cremea]QDU96873.1 hypothetical protein Pla8534_46950 [Lignipirellula cremea]